MGAVGEPMPPSPVGHVGAVGEPMPPSTVGRVGAEGEPTCPGGETRGGGVGAGGEPTPLSDNRLGAGEAGEVGGELSAPSSWPMTTLSAGDCAFLFFIALVRTAGLLLAGGRLPAASRGGDAATVALATATAAA